MLQQIKRTGSRCLLLVSEKIKESKEGHMEDA